MIISLNWLKKFTDINMPIDELTTLIGSRLVEIESVEDLGAKYKDVLIAEIKKVEKHPNADKLSVVQIDDDGKAKKVRRLDNGLVQVVCGAPNVKSGLKVAWLPPGAVVPETFNKEPSFVLDARELRGVMSNGMLASSKELAFGNDHSGILELDPSVKMGESFIKLLELDDFILDIENKSLTHRPDCFGFIGFAREVAAISGSQFKTPEWLKALEPRLAPKKSRAEISEPSVNIENTELCARYEAVVISGVDCQKKSPAVIQSYLNRVGVRPISATVDVTNYLMLVAGHPLHAFDYDKFVKIAGGEPEIVVRAARKGEKLKLLDGKTISLDIEDIVICAGKTPVALAGAMGGFDTEIDENTNNILLESATFNLYNLRSTQMRHGISSEAATRFTKGIAPAQTAPVIASAVRMLSEIAGGERTSDIIDAYPDAKHPKAITLTTDQINQTLGTKLSLAQITKTLQNAELEVTVHTETLSVTSPYWRADLHIKEDLIEEVGRLNGFDSIMPTLPVRDFTATKPSNFDELKFKLRTELARAGANEVLSYSFVPEKLLKNANQNPREAYKITNALSPELQHYRLSLTPSLLERVHPNIKSGFSEFALFEINKVHSKSFTLIDEKLPVEVHSLGLVYASRASKIAFFEAKKILNFVAQKFNVELSLEPIKKLSKDSIEQPYEPSRSAQIVLASGEVAGIIGEFKASTEQALKLPVATAGFEIDTLKFFTAAEPQTYQPDSKFPSTSQDVCLKVTNDISFSAVEDIFKNVLRDTSYNWQLSPVDIYQKSESDKFKQITLRIQLADYEKTLTSQDVKKVVELIVLSAKKQLNAEHI